MKNIFKRIFSAKRIFFFISLLILISGWLIVSGYSLYCSVSLNCVADASGWWSLFITIVGIPIVVFQLYGLRKSVDDLIKKPEAEIGILVGPLHKADIDPKKSLPTEANVILSPLDNILEKIHKEPELFRIWESHLPEIFFPLRIVVKNKGKRALRYVKIAFSLVNFPSEASPNIAIKDFKDLPGGKTAIFQGGGDYIIYPKDYDERQLFMGPDSGTQYLMSMKRVFSSNDQWIPDIADLLTPGKYQFKCMLWAEGLDDPVEKILSFTIIDDRDHKIIERKSFSAYAEKKQQKFGSSKYGFETDKDREQKQLAQEKKVQAIEEGKKNLEIRKLELAKQLDPTIQGILLDFIDSYYMGNYTISWDGDKEWLVKKKKTEEFVYYLNDYWFRVSLLSSDDGIINIGIKVYEGLLNSLRLSEEERERLGYRRDAIDKLKDVIKEVTKIDVISNENNSMGGY